MVCGEIAPVNGFRIRPWRAGDASVLANAWADVEISRWNPTPPDSSIEFAAKWIDGTSSQSVASIGIDVVVVDGNDAVRGEIGLQVDPAQNIAELGFWLTASARGQGMGRDLLSLAGELGRRLELVGMISLTEPDNDAATRLLSRSGWTEVPTTTRRVAFARRLVA